MNNPGFDRNAVFFIIGGAAVNIARINASGSPTLTVKAGIALALFGQVLTIPYELFQALACWLPLGITLRVEAIPPSANIHRIMDTT